MMYHLLYDMLPWFIDISQIAEGDRIEAILVEREKELLLPNINKFELDDQLINIISKALSQNVDNRFQTADEFIQAIDGQVKVPQQITRGEVNLSSAKQNRNSSTIQENTGKGFGFAAIAGMDELKKQMQEEVIAPLHHPEEYQRYKVTIPNGMLLYGPPGCGKTFFAKHFAEEVGFNFILVTPATLKSCYVNATQENIAEMFKKAKMRCFRYIDDF